MTEKTPEIKTTSQGHIASDAAYLDTHYAMAQPEYEAMLRSVGLQPGWQVLDAGCGGGSFHPLISHLVGPNGHIHALDLEPENIDKVKTRAASGQLQCSLEARVGPMTELLYPDNSIDAVWCANVTQYMSDEALATALNEFHRVVRPGGIVAIKDWDIPSFNFWPPGPRLMWHHYEIMDDAGDARIRQMFRSYELPVWLRRANFVNVTVKTTLTERFQPLQPADIAFLKPVLNFLSKRAQKYDLPADDLAIWSQIGNVDSPDSILNDPNFYFREGHTLVTGNAIV